MNCSIVANSYNDATVIHMITADFSGSIDRLPSATIQPYVQLVAQAETMISITSSNNPALINEFATAQSKSGSG